MDCPKTVVTFEGIPISINPFVEKGTVVLKDKNGPNPKAYVQSQEDLDKLVKAIAFAPGTYAELEGFLK